MTTIQTDTTAWQAKQGVASVQSYVLTESDGTTPIDISADTVTLYVSPNKGQEAVLTIVGDVATLGNEGKVTFTLTEAQTQALTVPNYFYEVVWDDGTNPPEFVAQGDFLVEQTFFWR